MIKHLILLALIKQKKKPKNKVVSSIYLWWSTKSTKKKSTQIFIRDKTKLYRIWGGDIIANKNLEVERETIVSFIFKRVNTLRCYIRVSTTRACHSHL